MTIAFKRNIYWLNLYKPLEVTHEDWCKVIFLVNASSPLPKILQTENIWMANIIVHKDDQHRQTDQLSALRSADTIKQRFGPVKLSKQLE